MPIIVKSKREGFRRCGVAFGKQEKTYKDGFFSADQLARLEAEPMLTVTRFTVTLVPEEKTGEADGVEKTAVPETKTGPLIEGAPADEAELLEWLEVMTVADLKEICTDLEIDVSSKARKAELIELITFNTAFPAGDPEE